MNIKKSTEKKELSIYDYVGKFSTESFFKGDVKRVIIRVKNKEALLEYPPFSWNESHNDNKLHSDYVNEKKKEGWDWSASWGYYFFHREIKPIETGTVEIEINPLALQSKKNVHKDNF